MPRLIRLLPSCGPSRYSAEKYATVRARRGVRRRGADPAAQHQVANRVREREVIVLQRRELRKLALNVEQLLEERLLDRIAIDSLVDEVIVGGDRCRDLVHLRVVRSCCGMVAPGGARSMPRADSPVRRHISAAGTVAVPHLGAWAELRCAEIEPDRAPWAPTRLVEVEVEQLVEEGLALAVTPAIAVVPLVPVTVVTVALVGVRPIIVALSRRFALRHHRRRPLDELVEL